MNPQLSAGQESRKGKGLRDNNRQVKGSISRAGGGGPKQARSTSSLVQQHKQHFRFLKAAEHSVFAPQRGVWHMN